MNLQDRKEGYMDKFRMRKGKGERYNYIEISKK